ncbi:MAG: nucleotidyltransferase domain-containing protein, partial [Proteobacteria bacterium]|nr:nucleotidyltransferase domain-containing protein [Pseudomonadota bacterium]
MTMWDTTIKDPVLFDEHDFCNALATADSPLTVFKDAIQNCNHYQIEEFEASKPIKELVHKRAWFIDQLLIQAWQQAIDSEALCLVAVGGYGRGELHPASDIDIMLLTAARINPALEKQIEKFLTFLWDIGLEIGHSVRTVKGCARQAR